MPLSSLLSHPLFSTDILILHTPHFIFNVAFSLILEDLLVSIIAILLLKSKHLLLESTLEDKGKSY